MSAKVKGHPLTTRPWELQKSVAATVRVCQDLTQGDPHGADTQVGPCRHHDDSGAPVCASIDGTAPHCTAHLATARSFIKVA
jgi:hypothetical protein